MRRSAVIKYAEDERFDLIVPDYSPIEYFKEMPEDFGDRCVSCYRIRLEASCRAAVENGFDGFTTTLLASPWQDRKAVVETGIRLADEHDTIFLEHDYSSRWDEVREMSKEMYRQKYCGCIFSEFERAN